MKLIVGLGNPGSRYELTRHNSGFLIVDQLVDKYVSSGFKEKGKVLLAEAAIGGEKVLLAKPQTFMNLSGQGVIPLAQFYKIAPADILVIYDDLDLEVGKIRLRPQGGSGGHNGIKSIIQLLGTEEFPRLKIGIGRPPANWDTADYVLSRFTSEEWSVITKVIDDGVAAAEAYLKEGIHQAMNKYN
ncbi:MAG: aminoacyl-tRNA hydrolase [Clostridia bacterium]|nr:aminoacyl-tRNA hydrolase [Clostridia bacterium]